MCCVRRHRLLCWLILLGVGLSIKFWVFTAQWGIVMLCYLGAHLLLAASYLRMDHPSCIKVLIGLWIDCRHPTASQWRFSRAICSAEELVQTVLIQGIRVSRTFPARVRRNLSSILGHDWLQRLSTVYLGAFLVIWREILILDAAEVQVCLAVCAIILILKSHWLNWRLLNSLGQFVWWALLLNAEFFRELASHVLVFQLLRIALGDLLHSRLRKWIKRGNNRVIVGCIFWRALGSLSCLVGRRPCTILVSCLSCADRRPKIVVNWAYCCHKGSWAR